MHACERACVVTYERPRSIDPNALPFSAGIRTSLSPRLEFLDFAYTLPITRDICQIVHASIGSFIGNTNIQWSSRDKSRVRNKIGDQIM